MDAPKDCSLCPRLVESRVAVVNGKGPMDAEVLIVAQNPGEWEEVLGYPLCEKGWSGRKVRDKLLPLAGLTPEEVRWENIARCRPPRMPKGGDYPPTAKEVSACRGFLLSTIQTVAPKVIITLGAPALDWFFPDAKLSSVHGQRLEWEYVVCNCGNAGGVNRVDCDLDCVGTVHSCVLVPQYHPASATPNRSPKLALVMTHDWEQLGEYLNVGRSRSSTDRDDGNGGVGNGSPDDVGRDNWDSGSSLENVVGLGAYQLKSGEEIACILRTAFGET